jgi:hypothetical protein
MCRRLGAAHTAGHPSTTVPCGDACASMPVSPIPAPLTLRESRLSFLGTHTKHENRSAAVSEGAAASGPTSPRSLCPAPGPLAPADRPAPAKVIISADQEGGAKNGAKNGPDWPRWTKCMLRKVKKQIFLFILGGDPWPTRHGVWALTIFGTSAIPLT